ncbi:MAG: ATP-binding protein [Deltaproteobacteria bacterium]|jgi:ATP-dependent DNA helicase RecG|nr:ATP-binding protein [Deltaproteobacteria bacterium]
MEILESLTVEFKSNVTPKIKNEVIAFTNTKGGTIYIGVDDKGKTVGLSDPDGDFDKIVNMLRDGIKPDIMEFIAIQIEEHDGKRIITVKVETGSQRP